MPLFRCAGEIHYFAHVPKCAGRSVEIYLEARFGELGFLERDFRAIPLEQRWSKSSPQHIPASLAMRLFPADWIASSFAVVRHPVSRVVSSYNYYLASVRTIPAALGIEEWFDEYLAFKRRFPYWLDNHLRPQVEMVPEAAAVFRLEDGLGALVEHLDHLAGTTTGPREIPHEHGTPTPPGMVKIPLSAAFSSRLEAYYAADYRRFGYDPDPARPARVLAPERRSALALPRLLRHRLKRRAVLMTGRAIT